MIFDTDVKIDGAIVAISVITILANVTITKSFYVGHGPEPSDSNKSKALRIARSNEEDVDESKKKVENEHTFMVVVIIVRQLLVAYSLFFSDKDKKKDMEALEQLAKLMLEVVSTISAIQDS